MWLTELQRNLTIRRLLHLLGYCHTSRRLLPYLAPPYIHCEYFRTSTPTTWSVLRQAQDRELSRLV